MKTCRTIPDFRKTLAGFRAAGDSIGLVPTMGALHDGHMALVAAAAARCQRVAVTLFVNPTQFGEAADLENYPRTEEADLALLRGAGVDAVLIPPVDEIYPEGDETIVETTRLANIFHGQVRPGHFRGVTTVVARLFNIAQPDHAFFGEKDYQQLAVIRRMARDLHFPLAVHGVPTVREADGLALSSRNRRLDPRDRAAAPVLCRSLDAAERAARRGATVEEIAATIRETIAAEPRATLEGLDIVNAADFTEATGPLTGKIGIMISARFGEILLIDQRELSP